MVYFWALDSVPLIYIFVFMLTLYVLIAIVLLYSLKSRNVMLLALLFCIKIDLAI